MAEDRGYTTPCHIWQGPTDPHGYGTKIIVNGQRTKAHRLAWVRANGPIPSGLSVLHHCDQPGCGNPEHLFLGTQTDNMADMTAKGRRPKGERNGASKLTQEQVDAIRAATGVTQQALADRYGVSRPLISMIKSRRVWA